MGYSKYNFEKKKTITINILKTR